MERPIIAKPLKLTASIIDSIGFHRGFKLEHEWHQKSYDGLIATLRRQRTYSGETTRGADFESKVLKLVNAVSRDVFISLFKDDCICDPEKMGLFYDRLHGCAPKIWVRYEQEVGGQRVNMAGEKDATNGETILDIKTINEWKADGPFSTKKSYEAKVQHLLYCTADNKRHFTYLFAEFMNVGSKENPVYKIISTHEVPISFETVAAAKKQLDTKIKDALDFMYNDGDLWDVFINVYNA